MLDRLIGYWTSFGKFERYWKNVGQIRRDWKNLEEFIRYWKNSEGVIRYRTKFEIYWKILVTLRETEGRWDRY